MSEFAHLKEVFPGWKELLQRTEDLFPDAHVKEKFGGLRIYPAALSDETLDQIFDLEKESFQTCQICGEPGVAVNTNGWFTTRCGAHK